MKKIISFIVLLIFSSSLIQAQNKTLKQQLENRPYPKWFTDAKLGIFIHWGLYSVPAYGDKEDYSEWFLRGLQSGDTLRTEFLKRHYGDSFTYNDFTDYFKAELFNPKEWATLFKKAGAKYVVLVSKHHDGYTLWPSQYNRNWNSVDTGPKKDIVGDLTKAVKDEGLKMGLYYSLPEWNHPLHRWYQDPHDSIAKYVDQYMIPQFKELVSTYRPSLIFADGEWFNTAEQWHSAELIQWYYHLLGKEAIVNNRWGSGLDIGFLTPEYSAGLKQTDRPWVEVRGIGRSFGLNRNENLAAYGTSAELIHRFVQTVANGGGMIINVGPKADGQIPLIQQERLIDLGQWLKINGEAIYGAQTYDISEQEKEVVRYRTDPTIDFNWVRNSPIDEIKEDHFTAQWRGFISTPQSGTYTFELNADDEASLSINNQVVIKGISDQKGTDSEVMEAKTGKNITGHIKLKKGQLYPIQINYQEKKLNAHIQLFWSTKGIEKEIVPNTYLYTNQNKITTGLSGTYRSKKTHLCYTINNNNLYAISFEWPDNKLVLKIPKPSIDAKVKLLGLDRTLDWTYQNDTLIIDTSGVKFSELPSLMAWTFKISLN